MEAGDYAGALQAADRMQDRCQPGIDVPCVDADGDWPQPLLRAIALRAEGRLEASRREARAAMAFFDQLFALHAETVGAPTVLWHAQYALAAGFAGDTKIANAQLGYWLEAEADPRYEDRFRLAMSREIAASAIGGAGDADRAFAFLRRALTEPGTLTAFTLRRQAYLYPDLRDDPRWSALIEEFIRRAPALPPGTA